MQLGNGRWESTVFNSRLQPTQIALGTVQSATDKLKLTFDYGTTTNNGNVLGQTITVPTETRDGQTYAAFTAVQTYSYDSLNRIKDAKEMIGAAEQWKQTFDYDRYGNRRFDANNTTTLAPGCQTAVCNPTIDPATNKLIGYSFDNAGNTKLDAENREFIHDGENKQVEVKDQNGASIGKYAYNGDGQRVKKISATESTVFVYNASGQLVGEYATQITQPADAKVSYLTTDHLGSPRITTDANGQVISRRDFQPFGEEIARAGYGDDDVRQKFTGYERDDETALDFAQARMYNKNHGRFTSSDPFNIVFEKQLEKDPDKGNRQFKNYISKPEQWNRYVYAINNPLKFVDPDGREIRLDPNLTEAERNEILYHLQKLTRDKLNWKTDKNGNVVIVATKIKGAKGKDAGTRLISRLIGYKSVTTINLRVAPGGSQQSLNITNESNGVGSDSIVEINLTNKRVYGTFDENTGISRQQDTPVWITLAHELIHADHAARGTTLTGTGTYSYKDTNGRKRTARENRYELATVGIGGLNNRMDITENDIRKDQGLRLRSEY